MHSHLLRIMSFTHTRTKHIEIHHHLVRGRGLGSSTRHTLSVSWDEYIAASVSLGCEELMPISSKTSNKLRGPSNFLPRCNKLIVYVEYLLGGLWNTNGSIYTNSSHDIIAGIFHRRSSMRWLSCPLFKEATGYLRVARMAPNSMRHQHSTQRLQKRFEFDWDYKTLTFVPAFV